MPYVRKDKLGPERAKLRDTYPHLNIVKSRHDGKKRFIYFQAPGKTRVRLTADPIKEPAKFREQYEAATRGEPIPDPEPVRRSRVETWNAAIDLYQQTNPFRALSDNTLRLYRPFIEGLRAAVGNELMKRTDPWVLYQMHDRVIQEKGPTQANTFYSVLKNIVFIGRVRRWVPADVDLLLGIEHQEVISKSYRPYKDDEIEKWRAHHALGTMARAAFELAYGLALANTDLIALAPCHIDDDGNVWIARRKTGTTQTSNIEADPTLREVFALFPAPPADAPVDMKGRSVVPYLRNQYGQPFALDGSTFRKQWRRWATEAGLPADFKIHGARATMVTDMMDAGVANSDGMRRTGHVDERVYTRIYGQQASATKAAARAQTTVVAARARQAGNSRKAALRAVA